MGKPRKIHPHQFSNLVPLWKQVQESSAPADQWLGNYFYKFRKRYGSRDRKFVSEIIYSCFRHKILLEHYIEHNVPKKDSTDENFMILAAFLAVMIEAFEVEELIRSGGRNPEWFHRFREQMKQEADSLAALSIRYSMPIHLIERWEKQIDKAALMRLLQAQNERPPLMLRANTLVGPREGLMNALLAQGHATEPTRLSSYGIRLKERANLFGTDEFRKGFFEIQDDGSQLVAEVMEPRPSDLVWDVCAGAGGKSLALSALMHNKGRVVATDIRPNKLEDLKKRAKRAAAHNIFPADINRMDEMKAAKKGFDRILVDAPCSGSGTLRRNPDAKYKIKDEHFDEFHVKQLEILNSSKAYLKENGFLYYVTCSIDRRENEEVAETFLKENSNFELYPIVNTKVGQKHGLSIQSKEGMMRLWPHEHETDGFFMAIFKKKSAEKAEEA